MSERSTGQRTRQQVPPQRYVASAACHDGCGCHGTRAYVDSLDWLGQPEASADGGVGGGRHTVGRCGGLQVADARHGLVAVRDSRTVKYGGAVLYPTRQEFAAFLAAAKAGQFDHLVLGGSGEVDGDGAQA